MSLCSPPPPPFYAYIVGCDEKRFQSTIEFSQTHSKVHISISIHSTVILRPHCSLYNTVTRYYENLTTKHIETIIACKIMYRTMNTTKTSETIYKLSRTDDAIFGITHVVTKIEAPEALRVMF